MVVELTSEISDFMDTIKRTEKHSHIDYITPLVVKYNITPKQAEKLRHNYVLNVFKKFPFTIGDPDNG